MKKRIIIILLLVILPVASLAQGFYGGIRGGLNFTTVTKTSDAFGRTRGNVGGFIGFQFSTVAAIQAEAMYSFQGAKINDLKLNLDYIKIPVMVKLYLIGGLNIEGGVSFNLLTSALIDGSPARGYGGFDFSIPVGVAYQLGKHFELGVRYDISLAKYNPQTTGSNSVWSLNLAVRL